MPRRIYTYPGRIRLEHVKHDHHRRFAFMLRRRIALLLVNIVISLR